MSCGERKIVTTRDAARRRRIARLPSRSRRKARTKHSVFRVGSLRLQLCLPVFLQHERPIEIDWEGEQVISLSISMLFWDSATHCRCSCRRQSRGSEHCTCPNGQSCRTACQRGNLDQLGSARFRSQWMYLRLLRHETLDNVVCTRPIASDHRFHLVDCRHSRRVSGRRTQA